MYLSILQEGGLTIVLPTPTVIRVVFLHKQGNRAILYSLKCISLERRETILNYLTTTLLYTTVYVIVLRIAWICFQN